MKLGYEYRILRNTSVVPELKKEDQVTQLIKDHIDPVGDQEKITYANFDNLSNKYGKGNINKCTGKITTATNTRLSTKDGATNKQSNSTGI